SWIGLAGSVGTMTALGLPTDITLSVFNLNVIDNIAASDSTRLNWKALADQTGDGYGLDSTRLATVTNTDSITIAGVMLISIEGYVYLSGALALQRKTLDALTVGSSTPTPMSTLLFGASNVKAFVGDGGPYWTVADTLTLSGTADLTLTDG